MPRLCDRIGVIGNGFVGRAIARGFLEHCGEVRIYDKLPERSPNTLLEALDCEWTFVCVPTPSRDDGRCDVDAVVEVIETSAQAFAGSTLPRIPRLVIKSTVPVGFTNAIQDKFSGMTILHSPEFLTQRCALVDFQTPARNIVGVPGWPGIQSGAITIHQRRHNLFGEQLAALFQDRFPGVPAMLMSSDESELVKLAQNGFFATKVAYFNAIYQLAKATGCDFEAVRAGMLADGRIAHAHTEVPGPSGELGFGGGCLPKDTRNLIATMWDVGKGELQPEANWLFDMIDCNRRRRGE